MSRASVPWQTTVFRQDSSNKAVTKINTEPPVSHDMNPTEAVASPFH